jgi:putative ABC transport system substrate-binding protein
MAALGAPAAVAAKAATATIPIVFQVGADPVAMGLIASLIRPSGDITGISNLTSKLGTKKLRLLREVVPTTTIIGLLVNPANPNNEIMSKDMQAAARTLGVKLVVPHASTEHDIDEVFINLVQARAGALVINPDTFISSRVEQAAALTARYAMPTIYGREFGAAGGLMGYGPNLTDAWPAYTRVGFWPARSLPICRCSKRRSSNW